MTKQYPSLFLPNDKIDLANYLTEIIICNYLTWQKMPLPSSPFWQQNIASNSDKLKELRKRYGMELAEIKNLLKVFNQEAIALTFKEIKPVSVKQLKADNRAKLILTLYNNQIKTLKNQKKEQEIEPQQIEYKETKGFSTKKKAIGL